MRIVPTASWALLGLFAGGSYAQEPAPRSIAPAGQPSQSFEEANALALQPRWLSLTYGGFDTRGAAPAMDPELERGSLAPGIPAHFIVQLDGPVTEAHKQALRDLGVEVLDYVPNYAFMVRATPEVIASVERLPEVVWTGVHHPGYRIAPDLLADSYNGTLPAAPRRLVIESFANVKPSDLEAELAALDVFVDESHAIDDRWLHVVSVPPAMARRIAHLEDVQWIEYEGIYGTRNNTTKWTIQTFQNNNQKIWNQGIRGEGQVVGHIDGALAINSCYFSDPGTAVGASHRKVVYRNATGSGSHGTHTAGTAVGDAQPITGSTSNRGMAHQAKIATTESFGLSFTSFANAHRNNGARVHTNSWGDDFTTSYNSLARSVDSFSWSNEDHLVMFAVTNGNNLRNPENAKNLIAVGASLNGSGANSFCSGGQGPTADGRRKPEVYGPGCSISSASTSSCGTTSQTGTSMACPAVTGAAALVRQYFVEGYYPTGTQQVFDGFTPTGALIKAMLINTSQNMTGISGYPSNREGWGRLNLDESMFFAGDTGKLFVDDIRRANGMSTNDSTTYDIVVSSNATPLEITLAFHDAPGTSGASNPVVNDLDLRVTAPNGNLYLGNRFVSSWSSTGGTRDAKNNVERVAIQSPAAGIWRIEVFAQNVPNGPQGYGMVATGDILPPGSCSTPVVYCNAKLNSQFCLPAIAFSGTPSVTDPGPFAVSADQMLNNKPGLLFFGYGSNSLPFQGGTLCIQPPTVRTPPQSSGGSAGGDDCTGTYSYDFNALIQGGTIPALTSGQTVYAQYWARDPQDFSGFATSLTDGLEFTICD